MYTPVGSALSAVSSRAFPVPTLLVPGGVLDGKAIKPVRMAETPVTNREYQQYVDEVGRERFFLLGQHPTTGALSILSRANTYQELLARPEPKGLYSTIPMTDASILAIGTGYPLFLGYGETFPLDFSDCKRFRYPEWKDFPGQVPPDGAFLVFEVVKNRLPEGYGGPNQPAGRVNWVDAMGWCLFYGGRLPTDDEWTHAARGGIRGAQYPTPTGRLHRRGEDHKLVPLVRYWKPILNVRDQRLPRNPWGLIGMASVYQWTAINPDIDRSNLGDGPYGRRGGGESGGYLKIGYRLGVNSPTTRISRNSFRPVWDVKET